jgi:LPPG:FO 2-phospho-L-lactate transferase
LKVVALAGGTGSAKLLRGFSRLGVDLTVVANVGDNFWVHGLYVCPDVDVAMYTLAGVADPRQGWGVVGDTYEVLSQLKRLGEPAWFKLGDRDLATQVVRTMMILEGRSLTAVTDHLRRSFKVAHPLLPVSDDPVETHILSPGGLQHLQEFWVRRGGRPRVEGVVYAGASSARPSEKVCKAIEAADRVVVCPANPVTSIGPMLAIPQFVDELILAKARVTALSPMVGRAPFSGPAGKLMRGTGERPDSVGVANLYRRFLDSIVIDSKDSGMKAQIEALGVKVLLSDISLDGPEGELRLAQELLAA